MIARLPAPLVFLGAALVAFVASPAPVRGQDAPPPSPRPYVGIQMEAIELAGPAGGTHGAIRLVQVVGGTGAEAAGLVAGDIIIGLEAKRFDVGKDAVLDAFRAALADAKPGDALPVLALRNRIRLSAAEGERVLDDPDAVLADLRGVLRERPAGTRVRVEGVREETVSTVTIVLGARPEEVAAMSMPPNAELLGGRSYERPAFSPLLESWVERFELGDPTADLRRRLAALHDRADPFRLGAVAYVHRDPLALHGITLEARDEVASAAREGGVRPLVEAARRRLELEPVAAGGAGADALSPAPAPPAVGADLNAHLDWLVATIEAAAARVERAFAGLTDEERAFLVEHHLRLTERFETDIYIHTDEDAERQAINRRTIELAARVDRAALLDAARVAAAIADPTYLAQLRADLDASGADLSRGWIGRRNTPLGRVAIAGTGRHWHREGASAVLIDLGGDDFHANRAGASVPGSVPVSVVCDLGGDDSYESTEAGTQGAGVLGVGLLYDAAGDDHYIALRHAQGASFLGVGVLADAGGGADVYRGHAFVQGSGLFGAGVLADDGGDDRYEAHVMAQAVGMAGGAGVLADVAGDDHYYAKGSYPTGYGTKGVFEGWSQGCAVGFRTLASGGLALLWDGGGVDRLEAGNFCQGGGYYFGIGLLVADGAEGDRYIGSRYAQGFTAHQAIGAFVERGGDDRYETRHAVAQGLAWDESVTLFLDEAGDDHYGGGTGFSQGASAHNAITLFWDRAGADHYDAGQAVGRSGPNDYHGGTSLSLFIDEGAGEDRFRHADSVGRDPARSGEAHGIAVDLAGSVEAAVAALRGEAPPAEPPSSPEPSPPATPPSGSGSSSGPYRR